MSATSRAACEGCGIIREVKNGRKYCRECKKVSRNPALTPEQMQWAIQEARRVLFAEQPRIERKAS